MHTRSVYTHVQSRRMPVCALGLYSAVCARANAVTLSLCVCVCVCVRATRRWERMPEARFPVALTKPPKAHKPKSQGAASDAAHMSQADRDRLELQRALQSAGGGM